MQYKWDFSFLHQNAHFLLNGLGASLLLAAFAVLLGGSCGLAVALGRLHGPRPLRWFFAAFVEFFRNTPALIQLMWLYYAMPLFTGLQPKPFTAAAVAFSLYNAAYMSEIYRSGINAVDRGQWEASSTLGLRYVAQLRLVILPQAVRRMLPAMTSQTIDVFKLTAIASLIAYGELVYNTRVVAENEFRPIEAYTALKKAPAFA